MHNRKKQTILIVLDGWGYREDTKDNAIAAAKKPFFDSLWNEYPHTLLKASGLAVGLPEGQIGNSEVGHSIIGAGKIIDTDLVRISKAIASGEFDNNSALQALMKHANKNNSTLHLLGLVGDGGVHAYSEHLFAVIKTAKKASVKKVVIHAFTDGRDTPPQSAEKFIREMEDFLQKNGLGFIATISGRYYAMDRDNNWDRLAKAEEAIFEGKGNISTLDPSQYIKKLYQEGKKDEYFEPVLFVKDGKTCLIKEGDAIFFFNFRADRARMMSQKILERIAGKNILFGTMTEYSKGFNCLVAFPPVKIEATLAGEISKAGLKQVHIAETEKFAHATYFLDGGREHPYENEIYELIPSRKDVATHDLAPKMQAEAIADKAVEYVNKGTDFIFINFANADMVGHTANVPAIVEGIEELDKQLKKIVTAVQEVGGVVFITADHGNAELNVDQETRVKHTAHTTDPVPAIITDKNIKLKSDGGLADVAPTILEILNLPKPEVMTGVNLIKKW